MFLQIPGELQSRILDVSPFNAVAYGVLVLLLALAVIGLYRMYQSEKNYNRERDQKMLEVFPLILDRLKSQTKMPIDLEKLAADTKSIKESSEKAQQRLEDKFNELTIVIQGHFKNRR